jgi:hypothetical protein
MNDETAGLIRESKEPVEKFLDPGRIQTVILADTFVSYEEEAEILAALNSSPGLKKINNLVKKAHPVKMIGLAIIWYTFFNQEEPWCKKGHRDDQFP